MRAGRVMKARSTSGTCLLCHERIMLGEQIGQVVDGPARYMRRWVHATCINLHNRQEAVTIKTIGGLFLWATTTWLGSWPG